MRIRRFGRFWMGRSSSRSRFVVGGCGGLERGELMQGALYRFFYAFPEEMAHVAASGKYPLVFDTFYPGIKEKLAEYLGSDRRMKYSMGIYRHYPELDRQ